MPSAPTEIPRAQPVLPSRKRGRILPIALSVFALLLVTGVAVSSFFISNKLNDKTPVAPNAPESKPKAAELTSRTCSDSVALNDSFEEAQINAGRWGVVSGTGKSVVQSGGKMRISVDSSADATHGTGLNSAELLVGNFDASINIDSFTATTAAGTFAAMTFAFWEDGSTSYTAVRVLRENGVQLYADQYSINATGTVFDGEGHTLTSGSAVLHVQRRGNEFEAFVNDENSKVSLGKTTIAFTKPLHMELIGWTSSGIASTVIIDDLQVSCPVVVTTTTVTCTEGAKLSDNFEGSAIDTTKWDAASGGGRTISQTNGKLSLIADATVASTSGVNIISKAALSGDFDASVDVETFTSAPPAGKVSSIQLKVIENGGPSQARVGIFRDGSLLFARTSVRTKDGVWKNTANHNISSPTTKIFLQRRGNEFEAFVNENGGKVSLGKLTGDFSAPVFVEAINWRTAVALPATMTLDNLVVACPTAIVATAPNTKITNRAYENWTGNTAGSYDLVTESSGVSKNEIFVYAMNLENGGSVPEKNLTVTDSLTGLKQELLTFVDATPECSFNPTEKKVSCGGINLEAGEKKLLAFRVRVSADAVNGDIIKNLAKLYFGSNEEKSNISSKDLTISTVLGCNHTCTSDAECTGSLTCDTTTNKCRASDCLTRSSCNCATTAVVPKVTVSPSSSVVTIPKAAKISASASAEPTILPEAGILDIPGVAAFGGGLLLAVVGILLAL
jgi:hypothetical protein